MLLVVKSCQCLAEGGATQRGEVWRWQAWFGGSRPAWNQLSSGRRAMPPTRSAAHTQHTRRLPLHGQPWVSFWTD